MSYPKGRRYEQKLVRFLRERGIECERIPLSGALRRDRADLIVCIKSVHYPAAVKFSSAGFAKLYRAASSPLLAQIVDGARYIVCALSADGAICGVKEIPREVERDLARVPLAFVKRANKPWLVIARRSDLKLVCTLVAKMAVHSA